LSPEAKINLQMPTDRDKSLPRSKTAAEELPPPDTKRWTSRRKAAVVDAVLTGVTTMEEVCRRYGLSVDEFLSWHNAMERHGLPGLRATRLQNYRYFCPKKD
jgi:transposase-like protein